MAMINNIKGTKEFWYNKTWKKILHSVHHVAGFGDLSKKDSSAVEGAKVRFHMAEE